MKDSRSGRPGLPVPNTLCGLCGRKATLNLNTKKKKGEKKGDAESPKVRLTESPREVARPQSAGGDA